MLLKNMEVNSNGTVWFKTKLISQFLTLSFLLTQPISTSYLHASPIGGEVVSGTGSINQSDLTTTINQTSQKLSVDWQSFNVNTNERVQFIQPNSSSIALNRILSNNGSTIQGQIDANGQVILVNPYGVFFSSTASVNVGGLIASTLDIAPTDFMNGNYIFNEVMGVDGAVINSGTINASLGGNSNTGGNVALLGKQVKNDGLISATLGSVILAAGKQSILTFDNQGLIGVTVTKEVLQSELGLEAAVINNGEIKAEGGRVLLTASTSQDVFSQVVNNGALNQATSVVVNEDGSYTLGNGADVVNTGSIDVSSQFNESNTARIILVGENVSNSGDLSANTKSGNAGEIELHAKDTTLLTGTNTISSQAKYSGVGGIVKILGDKIGLFEQSSINVSGFNGGGQALIGGDYQGKNNSIRNARGLFVSSGSKIYADSFYEGNGGKIINWADISTSFYGEAYSRGGSLLGDGGLVEVSGKQYLDFRGYVNTLGTNGNNGVLLLDPTDITIAKGNGDSASDGNSTFAGANGTGQLIVSDTTPSILYQSELEGISGSTNIVLSASNTITIDKMNGDQLDLNTNNTNSVTFTAGGAFSMNTTDEIRTSGGSVSISGSSVTVGSIKTTGSNDEQGGAITLTATSGTINAERLESNGGRGGNGSLGKGNVGQNAGNITLLAATGITINDKVIAKGGRGNDNNNNDSGFDGGNGGDIKIESTAGNIIYKK